MRFVVIDPRTDEAGQLALAYKVYRCWVSEYQALPEPDANYNAVAIQYIRIENEGWERDYEVPVPEEDRFRAINKTGITLGNGLSPPLSHRSTY